MYVTAPGSTLPPAVPPAATRLPRWVRGVAVLGVLWNAYGIVQFVKSVGATPESLMASGLDAAQADLYLGLPGWTSVLFALGVFSGLLGSLALAMQRRTAAVVLGVSLVGYVLLFVGEAAIGLFAAIPGQLVIYYVVLPVALFLSTIAWLAQRRNWLR